MAAGQVPNLPTEAGSSTPSGQTFHEGDEGGAAVAPALETRPAVTAEPNESLDALLHRAFGFAAFRANQEQVCRTVIEGRDALLVMPTGAGKSLCYQLPGLARGGTTLVISPLIALMEDQFRKLRDCGFAVECIHSGRDRAASRQVCIDYLNGEASGFSLSLPNACEFPVFRRCWQSGSQR